VDLIVDRTPAGLPQAPTDLAFTDTSTVSGKLTWIAPEVIGSPTLKDYVIQYTSNGGKTWVTIKDGYSMTPSLPMSNLKSGVEYGFRVRAENGAGTAPWSSPLYHVMSVNASPYPVTGLAINRVTATSAELAWDVPIYVGASAISNYKILVSNDSGASWNEVPHKATKANTFTVYGLSQTTDWQVSVAAVNSLGTGPATVGAFTTGVGYQPTPPTNLVVDSVEGRFVHLRWDLPTDDGNSPIRDYLVQVSKDGGSNWLTVPHMSTTAGHLTVNGLIHEKTYTFRVAAHTDISDSEFTDSITATTILSAPSAPAALYKVQGYPTKNAMKLTWSAPDDNGGRPISNYQVFISSNMGRTWKEVPKGISISRVVRIVGLKSYSTYWIKIRTVSGTGKSVWSPVLKFTTKK